MKELRLKSLDISDDCIKTVSQIKSLEFLHLGGTNITCDALSELASLENLRRLIINPETVEKEKIDHFRVIRPGCELIVNPR